MAPADAPNLLLIVLDTVRADHLAPYGYHRVTTPRIDAFANERATRYTRARSAGTYTLPSHASLFTGLYPSVHGADHPRAEGQSGVSRWTLRPALGLRPDVPTLAEVLHEHGWRTAAIVANNVFLHHSFGLDRGFERYDDRDTAWTNEYLALAQYAGFALRTGHLLYRDGDEITAEALRWIDGEGARPFFLMLNYMDAHAPYMPRATPRMLLGRAARRRAAPQARALAAALRSLASWTSTSTSASCSTSSSDAACSRTRP